ncbi:hypothetical protein [Mucilaginibacter kameinonensis]|uniref:hypothetical protein n=1 Tax=Mucilaginibacter kameinonensis TaxID=452286 RepID=UPI0013CEDA27|nr:hypothetical protein [Mucilaginibacter kameinonensis]
MKLLLNKLFAGIRIIMAYNLSEPELKEFLELIENQLQTVARHSGKFFNSINSSSDNIMGVPVSRRAGLCATSPRLPSPPSQPSLWALRFNP